MRRRNRDPPSKNLPLSKPFCGGDGTIRDGGEGRVSIEKGIVLCSSGGGGEPEEGGSEGPGKRSGRELVGRLYVLVDHIVSGKLILHFRVNMRSVTCLWSTTFTLSF